MHPSVEFIHPETNGIQGVDSGIQEGRRTDSPGERDWHSWGVSEGSCWAERDTMPRVPSR